MSKEAVSNFPIIVALVSLLISVCVGLSSGDMPNAIKKEFDRVDGNDRAILEMVSELQEKVLKKTKK